MVETDEDTFVNCFGVRMPKTKLMLLEVLKENFERYCLRRRVYLR